jgi:hypothetical protein
MNFYRNCLLILLGGLLAICATVIGGEALATQLLPELVETGRAPSLLVPELTAGDFPDVLAPIAPASPTLGWIWQALATVLFFLADCGLLKLGYNALIKYRDDQENENANGVLVPILSAALETVSDIYYNGGVREAKAGGKLTEADKEKFFNAAKAALQKNLAAQSIFLSEAITREVIEWAVSSRKNGELGFVKGKALQYAAQLILPRLLEFVQKKIGA